MFPSTAVIEDGQALWVLGGMATDFLSKSITQIVRPGQPTVRGPDMTEVAVAQCSTTLANGDVIMTGGTRAGGSGSASTATEVYSFTERKWTRKAAMNQRRFYHSCCQVWLDPHHHPHESGVITTVVSNSSVLSVVVAGGRSVLAPRHHFYSDRSLHR